MKRKLSRIDYFYYKHNLLVAVFKSFSYGKDKPTKVEAVAVVNEHAAGIDVGSMSYYVAIGQQPYQVREFGCYTSQIHELCRWLRQNQITTIALESTGSYWKALFILLQDYGLNPILVNEAAHCS